MEGRGAGDSASGSLALCRRQQVNVLKYLLRMCITEEVNQFKQDPMLQNLEKFPFLDFVNKVWIRSFPWIQEDSKTFWDNINELLAIRKSLQPASAYRDDSKVEKLYERLINITVILFKNTLRPYEDRKHDKAEKERDEAAYNEWKNSFQDTGLPTVSIQTNKQKQDSHSFRLKILTSRRTETSGKAYEVYVIESNYKGRFGRMEHRFSAFLLLHECLSKNFKISLPTPPSKHRFSKHTSDFIETRRRDLEAYLKALCDIPEIRDSGEINAFLLAGEATHLTQEEKIIQEEEQRNLAYANATLKELLENVKSLLSTEEGIARLYKLYPTLKEMPNFSHLPADYANILRLTKTITAYSLYFRFHCEDECEQNIQKAKLLYRLTPFTAIKGILAITNPVNFLQDLANIFLTKPLNTKNLAQLMVSETASQNPEYNDNARKARISVINSPAVCQKIFNVINNNEALHSCFKSGNPNTQQSDSRSSKDNYIRNILSYEGIQPNISDRVIDEIMETPSKLSATRQLIEIELRHSDIRKIVEFCGNDKIIQILKNLTSLFFKPLAEAYQSADMNALLSLGKKSIAKILSVAENRSQSSSAAFAAYRDIVDEIEKPLFEFAHQIIQNDSGTLEETINWFLALLDKIRKDRNDPYCIDFDDLTAGLYPSEIEALERDLNELDHSVFMKLHLREIKVKALKEYHQQENPSDGEISLTELLASPGQSDGIDLGEHLGVSGFISDEDLEDLSISEFESGSKSWNSVPKLHALSLLAPKFKALVQDVLFSRYEDFLVSHQNDPAS
mmetsp:Transcript_4068/g.5048  ORF Transcript_4068/g.5048 Transcript_4068/m.5048 type:complete len:793 (-) Transcript_4068:104-2482(-)